MTKKYLSIMSLIIAIIVFLYMSLGHRFGASPYILDIFFFIAAPITAFYMPKGKLKYVVMSLSFVCLFTFAGFTFWMIYALNHIGPK